MPSNNSISKFCHNCFLTSFNVANVVILSNFLYNFCAEANISTFALFKNSHFTWFFPSQSEKSRIKGLEHHSLTNCRLICF